MVDASLNSLLRDYVQVALARAKDDFETIVADTLERMEGEVDRAAVEEVARAEFTAYQDEQRGWNGALLDSERLLAAFRDLDTDGIVARADFTCCQTCGTSEIAAESPGARGYVFCHRQDVDAAALGRGGLFLSFGTLGDDGDPAEIAGRAVEALNERGLKPEWDGEVERRIHVPITWRRRRYGSLALPSGVPDAPVPEGPLMVTFCDYRRDRQEDEPVAMTFEEFRGLLFELVPSSDNFITCQGRSGDVVQGMWDEGPRFWLETPDTGARCSYGRWVSLDEAAQVVRALADDDRVALTDLGDLETVSWTT